MLLKRYYTTEFLKNKFYTITVFTEIGLNKYSSCLFIIFHMYLYFKIICICKRESQKTIKLNTPRAVLNCNTVCPWTGRECIIDLGGYEKKTGNPRCYIMRYPLWPLYIGMIRMCRSLIFSSINCKGWLSSFFDFVNNKKSI